MYMACKTIYCSAKPGVLRYMTYQSKIFLYTWIIGQGHMCAYTEIQKHESLRKLTRGIKTPKNMRIVDDNRSPFVRGKAGFIVERCPRWLLNFIRRVSSDSRFPREEVEASREVPIGVKTEEEMCEACSQPKAWKKNPKPGNALWLWWGSRKARQLTGENKYTHWSVRSRCKCG